MLFFRLVFPLWRYLKKTRKHISRSFYFGNTFDWAQWFYVSESILTPAKKLRTGFGGVVILIFPVLFLLNWTALSFYVLWQNDLMIEPHSKCCTGEIKSTKIARFCFFFHCILISRVENTLPNSFVYAFQLLWFLLFIYFFKHRQIGGTKQQSKERAK